MEKKTMNDYEIIDIEDVFGDPLNTDLEFYSTMSDKDKNNSTEDKEETKTENKEEIAEESVETSEEPSVDKLSKQSEAESAAVKGSKMENTVDKTSEEESTADDTPQEEVVLTAELSPEDEHSELNAEDSAEVVESKVEDIAVEETPEESAEDTEQKDEEVPPEVPMNPEEVAKMAMQTKIVQAVYTDIRNDLPRFRSGDKISVGYRVIEGSRSRVQIFEGVVIKISSGNGLDKTFTVRKISGGIGVERIFPFHSPNIESIKVLKEGKVRRAKLYYLRSRKGKAARIKERT